MFCALSTEESSSLDLFMLFELVYAIVLYDDNKSPRSDGFNFFLKKILATS